MPLAEVPTSALPPPQALSSPDREQLQPGETESVSDRKRALFALDSIDE